MLPALLLWRAATFALGKRLRNWLGSAVLIGFLVGGFAFAYSETIIAILVAPAEGRLSPFDGKLVYTGLTAGFGASVSLFGKGWLIGFIATMIPGSLTLAKNLVPFKWWAYTVTFLSACLLMFSAGIAFFYFAILPVMIPFLLRWNSGVAVPLIDLNEYLEEVTQLGISIGLMFITPIIVYGLAKGNIVTYSQMKSQRLWILLGLATFSVVITPSLEGTLTAAVFYPLVLLFEAGVFAAWLEHRHQGNYFTDHFAYGVVKWLLTQLFIGLPAMLARWVRGQVARGWRRLVRLVLRR